jgi:8-oxo-dGTP pyrophosphatase MutT (NUDIX family)
MCDAGRHVQGQAWSRCRLRLESAEADREGAGAAYSDHRMANVQQAGAIALRERNGATEVLLVRAKKDPSHWVFPKGHIERGETPADAAARELREEAGVTGSVLRPVGLSTFQSGAEQVDVTYYLVRFAGTVPPSEQRPSQWLPIDEARRTLSFDDARRLLDEAVRDPERSEDR